jgi:hypothetical protein
MQNNSTVTTITPVESIYFNSYEIPEEQKVSIPKGMRYIEGYGYVSKDIVGEA